MGFKVGIWVSRLEFGLQGRDLGLKGGDFGLEARGEMDRWTEEEEEENLVEFGKINTPSIIRRTGKMILIDSKNALTEMKFDTEIAKS